MTTISSFETFAKQRAIFLSVRKTVNIQGYSELREPIKPCKNCHPLMVNTDNYSGKRNKSKLTNWAISLEHTFIKFHHDLLSFMELHTLL